MANWDVWWDETKDEDWDDNNEWYRADNLSHAETYKGFEIKIYNYFLDKPYILDCYEDEGYDYIWLIQRGEHKATSSGCAYMFEDEAIKLAKKYVDKIVESEECGSFIHRRAHFYDQD